MSCRGQGGSGRSSRGEWPESGDALVGDLNRLGSGNRDGLGAAQLGDPSLGLLEASRQQRGLFTQVRGLPRVREIQQDQDGQADDRREPRVRPDRRNEVVHREGKRRRAHRRPVYVASRAFRPPSDWRARASRDTC